MTERSEEILAPRTTDERREYTLLVKEYTFMYR